MKNETIPQMNYEELPVKQQPIIENVPGMEPTKTEEPDATPITLDNPSAQTLRTANGTPYAEVAPGVMVNVSSEKQNEAPQAIDVIVQDDVPSMAITESAAETSTDAYPETDKTRDIVHASELHQSLDEGRRGEIGQEGEAANASTEQLENWAGILHDQPLSDAYKQRFGLVDEVTPELLVGLENDIEQTSEDPKELLDDKLKRTFLEDIRTGRAHQWQ